MCRGRRERESEEEGSMCKRHESREIGKVVCGSRMGREGGEGGGGGGEGME